MKKTACDGRASARKDGIWLGLSSISFSLLRADPANVRNKNLFTTYQKVYMENNLVKRKLKFYDALSRYVLRKQNLTAGRGKLNNHSMATLLSLKFVNKKT